MSSTPWLPDRRTVLKAAALPLVTLPVVSAGCGGTSRGRLRVAAVWSGWELTAFRKVLAGFTAKYGWAVDVLSTRDDIDAFMTTRVAEAAAPDIVMLPRPGLVRQYQDRLVPQPALSSGFPQKAQDQLSGRDGQPRGVWFKTSDDSMVWYRKDILGQLGKKLPPGGVPKDWPQWIQLARSLAGAGVPPLSLGAADGWALARWFDNMLLGLDPTTYDLIATTGRGWRSPSVRDALRMIGTMWSIPGAFPGGVQQALSTQFEDSVVDVFTRGSAAMVMQADFAFAVISRYGRVDADSVGWFPFPPPEHMTPRTVVGGDIAVLLRNPPPGAQDLMNWLASRDAAEIWAREGGFVSILDDVPLDIYKEPYRQPEVPRLVRDAFDQAIHTFSLSDQLTGNLSGGDGHGLWRVLQDFLAQVADSDAGRVESAVDTAVGTLAHLAGEE